MKVSRIKKNRADINKLYDKLEANEKNLESVKIFLDYENGSTVNELAEKYKISTSTVRRRISEYIKK